MADYIRYYQFNRRTSRFADIPKDRATSVRYDDKYIVSANFLNWAINKYDKDMLVPLNTVVREGKYTDDWWKRRTGHSLDELNDEWKADLAKEKSGQKGGVKKGDSHQI